MRSVVKSLALMASAILLFPLVARAVNPAHWQIAEQVTRSETSKTWISSTGIDLGKMLWQYEYEITKVTGTVSVPFVGQITQDITSSIPAEIRQGGGDTRGLPAVLLDDAIADPNSGTTADLLVEINQSGFGRAAFSNIMLGSVTVPIFGSRPIEHINVEATIDVLGFDFGDYNLNGHIDPTDYAAWSQAFGTMTESPADGNANQIVDAADYTIWRDNLPAVGLAAGAAAVPEPTSWLLIVCAAAGSCLRTNR